MFKIERKEKVAGYTPLWPEFVYKRFSLSLSLSLAKYHVWLQSTTRGETAEV